MATSEQAASTGLLGARRHSLVAQIRAAIVNGQYASGDLLSEVSLSTLYNVSRTPVREALKQLQTEGLVEVRPRVGTFVRRPTHREVAELFELKEALEGLAAKLLARRGHVVEIDALMKNLSQTEEAVEADDEESQARLISEFHNLLVDGADNTKLREHYRRLMNQLTYMPLVRTTLSHQGRPTASLNEHRAVLEFIVAKDSHGAEWAMRNHVAASAAEVLSAERPTRES
ncbi:GntR family transcriptional regulator [Spelaeicoccus albus]|uniref:DNA-binding GntR family transcriptional regulator n=1 Tax=Spelaeicoccus albus TaxID=1280376 RepID=A0A7Z0ACU0_9MICO|nr:GntR family transcriptional regulator [Spelaeicoccus albus]NYI66951.1 DNA-binding GntR family transcriptional regulator [Spelaeicoccus albus]